MTRRAIICEKFGIAGLTVTDWPSQELGPDDVKIGVKAVSLNYRDLMMIRGHYNPRLQLPLIPCSDGAGDVLAVGKNVTEFKPGDRVCSTMIPDWSDGQPPAKILASTLGGPKHGLLCSEQVLPANALLKVPDYLSYEEAACLPVAGLTAWSSLVTVGGIDANHSVLLLGTGGVSIFALQIAKALGAKVIITSSSEEKLTRVRTMGADATINYQAQPRWGKTVLEEEADGVDLVLEVGGAGTFDQSVRATKMGGRIALIGVLAAHDAPVNLTAVLMKRIMVQGILVGSRAEFVEFLDFLQAQELHPVVDKVFQGLDQAKAAFELMASGGHFGKIVIRL